MEKMNKNIYTTCLEVFHKLKIRYILNSIFFEQEKIVTGAKLPALNHNTNITREQVKVIDILIWLLCRNSISKILLNVSNEKSLKKFYVC